MERALGSGARGGRKKKKWLPECAPSEIMYAGPWLAGGCTGGWSRHPTEITAVTVTASARGHMAQLITRDL